MAKFIEWKLSGTKGNSFRISRKRAESTARELARDTGRILVRELKRLAPVGTHYEIRGESVTASRPETLKKSINFKTYQAGHGIVNLKIYAADYIKYVIYPTRPHWIEAKNVKFLRFFWPDAPPAVMEMFPTGIVFFKRVWHPGTEGNPFHQEALANKWDELRKLNEEAAESIKVMIEQFWD